MFAPKFPAHMPLMGGKPMGHLFYCGKTITDHKVPQNIYFEYPKTSKHSQQTKHIQKVQKNKIIIINKTTTNTTDYKKTTKQTTTYKH